MSECRSCGRPIKWEQNPKTERWVPYDPDGECHFTTCPGKPRKGSKKELEDQIVELTKQLEQRDQTIQEMERRESGYRHQLAEQKRAFDEGLEQYGWIDQYTATPWIQVVNYAKAVHRAREQRTGRVRQNMDNLWRAVKRLVEAEERMKKKR